jgi:hypothetical protein
MSRLIQFRLSEEEYAALEQHVKEGESPNLSCQRIVKQHLGMYHNPVLGRFTEQTIEDILHRLGELERVVSSQQADKPNPDEKLYETPLRKGRISIRQG